MALRPRIFISAVSKELRNSRQLIANTLQFLGYEPVWQDIFGTEEGDLRGMLRREIDACNGVMHLVGQCYGAEPPKPDEQLGRVSYTQYEALYARQRGKRVWYLVLDEDFPADAHDPESDELAGLQAAYRQRVKADANLFHTIATPEGLKAKVHELRNELARLRRSFTVWTTAVTALLVAIVALVAWQVITRESPSAATDERADAALVARNYAAAFDLYARLSDRDPANVSHHRHVEECARLGRLEKAMLDRYLALVARRPESAIFHNYLGNAYLLVDPQDKDGKGRGEYEAAARLDPKLASPLANLGILAHRAGRSDEAESFFRRYVAAAPGDAQGWVNLGLLYVAKVEASPADAPAVTEAGKSLAEAVRIEPGSAAAHKGLGRLWAATGRKKDALGAYERSLALDFDQPEVRQQVELLSWESGGARFPSTQADDFKTRSGTAADTNVPAVIIAMRLIDQGQFQEAEKLCLQWTGSEPENPLAWRLLGRAYEGQGRTAEARRVFDHVLGQSKADGR